MDLYIQIGVVFLFLTALAMFMYVYTEPVGTFMVGIDEVSEEIAKTLEDIKSKDVNEFYNNPNVSGVKVETLVKSASAKNLAVLVQTKNQQGLVVNYGYQIRSDEYSAEYMSTFGTTGTPTEFERRYVSTVGDLFSGTGGSSPGGSKSYGASANISVGIDNITLRNSTSTSMPLGSGANGVYGVPHLMFAHPIQPINTSMKEGNNYGSTGMLYTDQISKENLKQNNNFSYMDSPTSLYYLDRNGSYYTTLIINSNMEVIGVYVEEHGATNQHGVLGLGMLHHGVITSLY